MNIPTYGKNKRIGQSKNLRIGQLFQDRKKPILVKVIVLDILSYVLSRPMKQSGFYHGTQTWCMTFWQKNYIVCAMEKVNFCLHFTNTVWKENIKNKGMR